MPTRVVPVPCLRDNYAYLVIEGDVAAVVDPGDAAPIEQALVAAGVRLVAAWCTHHHADHTGGVAALAAARPGLEVVAHVVDAARFAGVTHPVQDDDVVALGTLRARVVHNPGHTLGACSFLVGDALFTGDTLFGAGCGRRFEGTPEGFHASLMRLASLSEATRVYFGHEYTAANLAFAAAVEPDSPAVAARAAALAGPTTPSTIGLERATNPFLRAAEPTVAAAVGRPGAAPAVVWDALRQWKDRFRA